MAEVVEEEVVILEGERGEGWGVLEGVAGGFFVDDVVVAFVFEDFDHFGKHPVFLAEHHIPIFEHLIPTKFTSQSLEEDRLSTVPANGTIDETSLAFGEFEEVFVLIEHFITVYHG